MIICFSENFLKLKVYYGELNFEVIEEEPAYTVGKNKISIVTVLTITLKKVKKTNHSLRRRKPLPGRDRVTFMNLCESYIFLT